MGLPRPHLGVDMSTYALPSTPKKDRLNDCDQITILVQCGQNQKTTVKGRLSTFSETALFTCPCCHQPISFSVEKPFYLHQEKIRLGNHTLTYVTYTTKTYKPPTVKHYYA